jgi:hypothetical protein
LKRIFVTGIGSQGSGVKDQTHPTDTWHPDPC